MKQILQNVNLFDEVIKEKKVKKHPEFDLQKAVCKYLAITYPKVLFCSDTIAFVELTKAQGFRNFSIQKHGFKTPDLVIFEPVLQCHGLFIEIKVDSVFKKKSDELLKDEQIIEQEKSLQELRNKGFIAEFGCGYKHCIFIIDNYLQGIFEDLSYTSYRIKKP